MEFGIVIFPTDQTMQPVELAQTVEAAGFESLWFCEHSHIPTSRATPWGGRVGAPPLPEYYGRTHDAFVALGAAAAVTERLVLGTAITLLAQRDPIWTAKEVATLDTISGGRVMFGVGYGWNREEMASHGVAYTERRRLLAEKVGVMKALWTRDVASFRGELVNLEPSWAWPKPVQRPHPPVVLGGNAGPKTITDMVSFCDGWMPIAGRHTVDTLPLLRRALDEAGRDPDAFQLISFAAKPDPAAVEELVGLGFSRALFLVDPDSPQQVADRIGELAGFVETFGD